MEKQIGVHRKGNPNDKFGFINNSTVFNLFIHDKEFNDNINRFSGRETYITFRIRPSNLKKGHEEGYDAYSLEGETDAQFLLGSLKRRLFRMNETGIDHEISRLCKIIIKRLFELNLATQEIHFVKEYFEEKQIDESILTTQKSSKFEIYNYGLELFFPEIHKSLNDKITSVQEEILLKQMGYPGSDKFEVLTELFFNNFDHFKSYYLRFPDNVNKEFIFKIVLESDKLPFEKSFESIKRFVLLVQENKELVNVEKVYSLLTSLSTPKIRLYLWLHDLTDQFDFSEYRENVWSLERRDQSLFLKKLFFKKYKGEVEFTLDDLLNIRVFDINHFREIKQKNGNTNYANLDFNISLLFYLLKTLSNTNQFGKDVQSKIFEYFLEYVQDFREIQHIDYFYPKCKGRTVGTKKIVKRFEIDNLGKNSEIESVEYYFYHQENNKPLYHIFCDGQRDNSNKLGFPEDKPYSWCTGIPCFSPTNNSLSLNDNYEEWSIIEFLRIFEITYDQSNISYLLGYINKTNLLLDRLKCKGCNDLLKPSGQNKFTYHNINNFHCANSSCNRFNEKVYLNHCLNKNCSNIIDSRVSKKCTQKGFEPNCGWYVCDKCYSCCSTSAIQKSIEYNPNYSCSLVGHDDLKEIFCFHCGDEMELNKDYYINQQKLLSKIINSKNPGFVEYKKNNNGFWQFRLNLDYFGTYQDRIQLISQLNSAGFKVSRIPYKGEVYSVSNVVSVDLKCKNSNCPNDEIFTPLKPSKWKAFSDKHVYLINAVKLFCETGDIKYLEKDKYNGL